MKKLLLAVLILTSCTAEKLPAPHFCDWVECEHTGAIEFKPEWGFKPGSDSYRCEKLHFENPEWTYEKCETIILKHTKN